MVQKGPFFLGDEKEVNIYDLIDRVSKECVIFKMMPSYKAVRPSLNDTDNIDESA